MNQLLDFFSSATIFILPIIIGSIWRGSLVSRFLKGNLTIFTLFFLASLLSSFFPFTFVLQFLLWGAVCGGVLSSLIHRDYKTVVTGITHTKILDWLSMGAILSLAWYAFFWLFKALTPYPFTLNWDVFEHVTLATQLLNGHVSLFPSQLTDTFTFNGYSPMFHVLLSLPSVLFGASLIGVYYYAEWWFFLVVIGISMWFAGKILGGRLSMFVSGILAVFSFASTVVYLPFFFLPQTLTATASIAVLLSKRVDTKKDILLLSLLCLSLLLTHYVIGFIGVGLILAWNLYEYFISTNNAVFHKLYKLIVIASISTFLLSMLLHVTGGFQITGREEAQYYQFSLSQLAHFFLQWYGVIGIVLLPLGIYWCTRSHDKRIQGILVLSLPLFALTFSPFSYTLKFFALGWYFLLIILTAAVTHVFSWMAKPVRWSGVLLFILTVLLVYYTNQAQYKLYLYADGQESHFSGDEIAAAAYINAQGEHTFIISDPATQGVLEALGESNSQGGVYMGVSARKTLSSLKMLPADRVTPTLSGIADLLPAENGQVTKRYFVASGRYFQWQLFSPQQKESVFYNVWRPYLLSDEDKKKIAAFKTAGMREVYHNKTLSIFAL